MMFKQLVFMVCACLFFTNAAHAKKQDDGYFIASAKFGELLSASGAARGLPRVTDPKVAALVATMSDAQRFLHSKQYNQDDMEYLLEMCGRANEAVMTYVMFDGRRKIEPDGSREQATEQVVKNMNENILAYQPEIELLMPFQLHCLAKQVPILSNFVDKLKPEELTNIRREGLNKMRKGLFRTYSGFFEMIANPRTRVSLREKVFAALADTAPQFSQVFSVVDRTQVIRLLGSLDPKQPAFVKKAVGSINTAMQNKDCLTLCKF